VIAATGADLALVRRALEVAGDAVRETLNKKEGKLRIRRNEGKSKNSVVQFSSLRFKS